MNKYMTGKLGFVFLLAGSLFAFACSANDLNDEKVISDKYYSIAKNLFDYETKISGRLYELVNQYCEKCEAEKEVSFINYIDVIDILDRSLANNAKNAKSHYLKGKIYWLLAYEGFGNYNQKAIGESKKSLIIAENNETNIDAIQKIRQLLKKIRSVEKLGNRKGLD